jgi:hypothetical protein
MFEFKCRKMEMDMQCQGKKAQWNCWYIDSAQEGNFILKTTWQVRKKKFWLEEKALFAILKTTAEVL